MMFTDEVGELLEAARLKARFKALYFQNLLLMMPMLAKPKLGTVAVTEHAVLLIDPEVVSQWSVPEMAGVLIHECLHVVLRHCQRFGDDHKLWNIAADLVVNIMVREMGLPLPGNPLWPKQFGFEEGLSLGEYVDLLKDLRDEQEQSGAQGQHDNQNRPNLDQTANEPGVGEGFCGSGAGRDVEDEPPPPDPPNEQKQGKGADGDEGDGAGSSQSASGSDGQGPPIPGKTKAQLERELRAIAETVEQLAKDGVGNLPGGMVRWAKGMLKPPKVRWQDKLAHATAQAVTWTQGAVDLRYDGPSRRQSGVGWGFGRPILPRLRRPLARVAVVVDTSGSMGSRELERAVSEIDGILKATDSEVDICACDAAVHTLEKVRTAKQVCQLLKGGGGTDFTPAFSALEKHKPRHDIIIFVTDGCGPAPTKHPRAKVIWVLVGPYRTTPYFPSGRFGEMIEVDEDR